jgi:hypothetical protein
MARTDYILKAKISKKEDLLEQATAVAEYLEKLEVTRDRQEYEVYINEEEFATELARELEAFIKGKPVDEAVYCNATKYTYVPEEDYIPYSIAGVYAGWYKTFTEVAEETHVLFYTHYVDAGEYIVVYIEHWEVDV